MTSSEQTPVARHPGAATREQEIGRGVHWLSRWTLRWLVIVVGAYVLGEAVQYLWSILLPIVLALIVTTVLAPAAHWLQRRTPVPGGLAAGLVIIGALAVVAGVVTFIAPSVGSQVADIADSASKGLLKLRDQLLSSSLPVTEGQLDDAVAAAQSQLQSSASSIASGLLVGVSAVTNALVNLVLTLVLTFFFIKDGHRFLPWLTHVSGGGVGSHLSEVLRRAWSTLGSFIRTQALVGLIDAVLIGLGLVIVGVPLAGPLAVLTFVAAFAPIVGAITIGAVAVLVALVANGWVAAVIVLLIVLAVQQLEGNVLLPWLQGKSLRLHAGVVLLSIVLGSTLFGVAGAFLSVPVVAVVAVVLRYLDELLLARTGQGPGPHRGSDTALAEQGDAERAEMDRHDDALRRGDVDPDELRARAHERGPGQGPAADTDDTGDDTGDDTRPLRGR